METEFRSAPRARERLAGEIALVTGGSKGIGLSIAKTLAVHGATVAIIGRSRVDLDAAVESIGAAGRVRAYAADVTDPSAMGAVVSEIEDGIGPISLLVNNAGMIGPIGPLADVDHGEWWRTVAVNLQGPALCMRLVLPRMFARLRGRVINLVSGAGITSFSYFSAYVAAKTALVRLTECAAAEAKPYGVFVFAMEPGTVTTAMSDFSLTSPEGQRWIPWFRRIFDEGLNSPVERPAQRALELASGAADLLTGRYLPLGEDLESLVAGADEVQRDALYSLRIRRAAARNTAPTAALMAIRAAGEAAAPGVLQLRSTYPAPRETIFALWTDAAAIAGWFLPPGSGASWARRPEIDPRPGGTWHLDLTGDDGAQYHIVARIAILDRPERLVLDWSWTSDSAVLGSGGPSVVTVEIRTAPKGSEVVIVHEGLPSPEVRDRYIRGWARCLRGIALAVNA